MENKVMKIRNVLLLTLLYSGNTNANCEWLSNESSEVTPKAFNQCLDIIENFSFDEQYIFYRYILSTQKAETIRTVFTYYAKTDKAQSLPRLEEFTCSVLYNIHSPLHALNALEEAVPKLIVNCKPKSLFYYALQMGQNEIVNYMLTQRRYDDQIDNDINLLAASASDNVKVFKELLSRGLDVNIVDAKNQGVAEYAIARDAKKITRFLDSKR
jgi:hypothetical protein